MPISSNPHQRVELCLGHPQPVALAALAYPDPAHAAHRQLELTDGTCQALHLFLRERLGPELDAARAAEARALGVAREALGAQQRELGVDRDGRLTVLAALGALGQQRAAGAAAQERCIDCRLRGTVDLGATAALEDGLIEPCHVELCVTLGTGGELHDARIGAARGQLE